MRRVALLTWAYPPEKSGLSRAAREIAQALAAAGADVRVFTMDRRAREHDGDVAVIGCGVSDGSAAARIRRVAAVGHLIGPAAFRRAVMAEHRVRAFDVIEATNWYAPAALLTLGDIPVVTRSSTPAAISAPADGPWRDRIDRHAAMVLEASAARRSSGWISNTRAHGGTIAALYGIPEPGERHRVIGLSLPDAIVARGRAASYPDGAPVELLFVGRNERRKGFDALCDAAAILGGEAARDALPAFRLTIVGATPDDLAALPDEAAARVRAFHRVEEDRLHDLLAAAHVVVAPSRYESFGLVYQEAMTFGRPVVACAEDASARLFIGDSGAGLLAAACTGAGVADQLRVMIADPAVRARHALASRRAAGRFTRETLARETLDAYRSAIGSKGRSNRSSSSGRPEPAAIPS